MRRVACGVGLLVASGCAELPGVPAGECGNGVVEAPEDCDSFGVDGGAECRPKGAVGQCHFDCSAAADGSRSLCPSGWGCDAVGICRKPTGVFAPLRTYEVGSAAALLSGDFDGDGRQDVVSLERPDALGTTRLSFHYFDERAELRETRRFARSVLAPALSELSGDAQSDVIFSDSRIGVLLGRDDRNWIPETFSSYRIRGTSIRTVGVNAGDLDVTSGFVVSASFGGVSGLYVPDAENSGIPRLLAPLAGPNEALAGHPVPGRLLEDTQASPCAQVVLALRGDTRFSMFDVCGRDSESGTVTWRETSGINIELNPGDPVDAPPQVLDLNADGHLDVLIGAGGRAFAAYGDGSALAAAAPYRLPLPDSSSVPSEIPMPLAAGDFTGDQGLDFVFADAVVISRPAQQAGRYEYEPWAILPPGYFRAAAIADFNDNDHLDVVAASSERTGIHFFNGSSTPNLNEFNIPTQRPVKQLAPGDYDGDFITDLAFTELGADGVVPSSVWMAFGTPAGAPLEPTQVARVGAIDQITPIRQLSMDHVLLASSEPDQGSSTGALAILVGAGDRIPMALYELTTFAADGATTGSAALRAFGGRFSGRPSPDVMAIAFDASRPLQNELEFWLLPELAVASSAPIRLEGGLPDSLQAVSGIGATARLRLAGSVLDVDADGLDELALAMPGANDDSCALAVLRVQGTRIELVKELAFDEPCTALELRAADVDADGAVDLALLNGREPMAETRLSVWWNDGAGGFDAERRTLVADASVSPTSFAALTAIPARNFTLAYATAGELHLAVLDAERQFTEPAAPLPIENCTGLTAADLNGDGALDLALARSGNLSVLEALLENL